MEYIYNLGRYINAMLPQKYNSLPFLLFITIIFSVIVSFICKSILSSKGYEVNMSFDKQRRKSDFPQLLELVNNEENSFKKNLYTFLIVLLVLSRISVILALISGNPI